MNNKINSFVMIGILFIFVFWSIFVNLVSSQNKMSSIGSVQVLDKHCWELVYINSTGTFQVWHKHFGGGVDFWVHYVYSMRHLVGIFFILCPRSIYYLFVHTFGWNIIYLLSLVNLLSICTYYSVVPPPPPPFAENN